MTLPAAVVSGAPFSRIFPFIDPGMGPGASGLTVVRLFSFLTLTAVHMVGGVAAAVGSYFLGPRKGRFVWDPDTPGKKKSVEIPGHNMTLASLGAILLWFGFFAFNGGSGYSITGSEDYEAVGRAVVVTTLGGASGAFVLMAWGMYATKSWRMGWVINGLLAGTVRALWMPSCFVVLCVRKLDSPSHVHNPQSFYSHSGCHLCWS